MRRGSTSRDGRLAHHRSSRLMVNWIESVRKVVHISTNANYAGAIICYLNQLFPFIVYCFSLPFCHFTLVTRTLLLAALNQSNQKSYYNELEYYNFSINAGGSTPGFDPQALQNSYQPSHCTPTS